MTNIDALLEENEAKDLLRFVTAGSVDDGKSTLIGRLLYESKGIYEDQLEAVAQASKTEGTTGDDIDLALLTDGLRAEREQGITIDVAYRYFSTPSRKFIIADSPGHEQYTRNMVTGASTASLVIILVDASKGIITQSKRHAFIASLLRIPRVLLAVNKMDLMDYSEDVFREIVHDFTEFAAKLELTEIDFIPVSALKGDNVVSKSERMPWYDGRSVLRHLDTVHIAGDRNLIDFRMPVQYVSRTNASFRGYMGRIESGAVHVGDAVVVLPSGVTNRVKEVFGPDGPTETAFASMSATLTLENEVDVSRGDVISPVNNRPTVDRALEAMVVWMDSDKLSLTKEYLVKHGTRLIPARITKLQYQVDVNTLHRSEVDSLSLNEIGRCELELSQLVAFDPYRKNRATGSMIIIDRMTNRTVGAAMVLDRGGGAGRSQANWESFSSSSYLAPKASGVSPVEREARDGYCGFTVFLTGLTGSRKRDIALLLEREFFDEGASVVVLDGHTIRSGVGKDLGFDASARSENLRRVAETARVLNDHGVIAICAFVAPYSELRDKVAETIGEERFFGVFVDAPVEYCRKHDAQGLYDKADRGEIKSFPGVNATYEFPTSPNLLVRPAEQSLETCAGLIYTAVKKKFFKKPSLKSVDW
ncbi:MAG: sulfate adenylyltransferase subunit CysN [Myxococcota bacterium]|nr:sulfate adenylyltransferase subunit CysN [Myxococcota bacterium]